MVGRVSWLRTATVNFAVFSFARRQTLFVPVRRRRHRLHAATALRAFERGRIRVKLSKDH